MTKTELVAAVPVAMLMVGAIVGVDSRHSATSRAHGRLTPTSVWDSVYTAEQATRGDSVYAHTCVRCHGADYKGGVDGAPLIGPDFMVDFGGSSVGDLYIEILTKMPKDDVGTVADSAKLDALAVLLRENGFPAGRTELPRDTVALKLIKIQPTRP